jgi:hypothetical protein
MRELENNLQFARCFIRSWLRHEKRENGFEISEKIFSAAEML